MGALEFRVLGPLEVVRSGGSVDLASAKQRAILAALILHANQVVSADGLVEAVWGGSPPSTAAHALQVHVSELRRRLEPGRGPEEPRLLLTQAPGYLLRVGPGELDSDRFENLTAEARAHLASGSPEVAAGLLDEALALWRGPALGDLAGSEVAQREAARLDELRQTAVEDRVEAGLACGRHVELVAELQALVAAHPFRERAWSQLLLALYRAGRQGHALEAYRGLRRLLRDELGVEPAPAVQDLHRRILRHDPRLAWTPRTTKPLPAAPDAADLPETRYVHHAGVNLAYQAFGQAGVDLVVLPGYFSHLEVRWEEPRLASLYRRLAAGSRLIMVDRRGSGLSDRTAELPAPQQQMDDVAAVMDAVGSRRAVFFGVSDGGVLALLLAALDPGRVAGVVTYAAYPVFAPGHAPGCGHSEAFLTLLAQTAGHRFVLDLPLLDQIVQLMAPGRADDGPFVRWLGRYSRLSAGPGATAAAFQAMRAIDIRLLLPAVQAPILVLHRRGDRVLPPANGRHLAEYVADARYVELPGDDHILWAGDVDVIAHEVERFLATRRT